MAQDKIGYCLHCKTDTNQIVVRQKSAGASLGILGRVFLALGSMGFSEASRTVRVCEICNYPI